MAPASAVMSSNGRRPLRTKNINRMNSAASTPRETASSTCRSEARVAVTESQARRHDQRPPGSDDAWSRYCGPCGAADPTVIDALSGW